MPALPAASATTIETDYLVVGAGATGMAFVDTLLTETAGSDVTVTLVDRHAAPGGHWNDAYPFVRLHQPSAFYGVNSLELGSGRTDELGLNRGLAELASGPEISGYYDRVMTTRLLPTGRVRYLPLSEVAPGGTPRVRSLLSGAETEVVVRRKTVDATYGSPSVPSTHARRFTSDPGVRVVPPGALPRLWADDVPAPVRFAVLGAGKTAMDTCLWLVQSGADPDSITWVVPRDSWLIDRRTTQTTPDFFDDTVGGQADSMAALAAATSTHDLFLRLEECGVLVRIDPAQVPSMFHLATVSQAEVAVLREVHDVVRLGRVRHVHADRLVLDRGEVPLAPGTVVVDCTASAVTPRPTRPVFDGDRVVLQMVRLPQPAFSAALIAYVEAHYPDDEQQQNLLCGTVGFPHVLDDYPRSMMTTMWNQYHWGQDRALRRWVRESRLDGFGALFAGADRDDPHQMGLLTRFREQAVAAMGNLPTLVGAS